LQGFTRHPIVTGLFGLGLLALSTTTGACRSKAERHSAPKTQPSPTNPPQKPSFLANPHLAKLFEWEEEQRAHQTRYPDTQGIGADPYRVVTLPHAQGFAGILRSEQALVLFNTQLVETTRFSLPDEPSCLLVLEDGSLVVASDQSSTLRRFRRQGNNWANGGTLHLPAPRAIRDLAQEDTHTLVALDEWHGSMLRFGIQLDDSSFAMHGELEESNVGHGPLQIKKVGSYFLINVVLEHQLLIRKLGTLSGSKSRVVWRNNGPIWTFDAWLKNEELWIVSTGVENHPLDRTHGSFGYIDSFVFGHRIAHNGQGVVRKVWELNVSEQGAVTPKTINHSISKKNQDTIEISSAGSDQLLRLTLGGDKVEIVERIPFVPGASWVTPHPQGGSVYANPLLDQWLWVPEQGAWRSAPVVSKQAPPQDQVRMGELLFFTTLMAPWNSSDGDRSRFTCETCHWEGNVDGRTHATGRGKIVATTKPLRGLWRNRPYFSRALDHSLTQMVNNEFRVAGARSDHEPWFAIRKGEIPWLEHAVGLKQSWSAQELRRSLLVFFQHFGHQAAPRSLRQTPWNPVEKQGATLFQLHCESCHQARLWSDQPSTRLPFEQWEQRLAAGDDLVWASDSYAQTGPKPYVHPQGARVPSLRRLYKKFPYFTTGTARSLAEVVQQFRFQGGSAWHQLPEGTPGTWKALSENEQRALVAFLNRL
jgi:hypothetical protein